ncbi:hypothetical protein KKC94_02505 [Patescibacteria group bacterium]|nr:hypothetical protein [Patescibacteria group bacterium]
MAQQRKSPEQMNNGELIRFITVDKPIEAITAVVNGTIEKISIAVAVPIVGTAIAAVGAKALAQRAATLPGEVTSALLDVTDQAAAHTLTKQEREYDTLRSVLGRLIESGRTPEAAMQLAASYLQDERKEQRTESQDRAMKNLLKYTRKTKKHHKLDSSLAIYPFLRQNLEKMAADNVPVEKQVNAVFALLKRRGGATYKEIQSVIEKIAQIHPEFQPVTDAVLARIEEIREYMARPSLAKKALVATLGAPSVVYDYAADLGEDLIQAKNAFHNLRAIRPYSQRLIEIMQDGVNEEVALEKIIAEEIQKPDFLKNLPTIFKFFRANDLEDAEILELFFGKVDATKYDYIQLKLKQQA